MNFAILIETISGYEFTCKDENGNPILFANEADAWKEIADDMITQLQQFIDGHRELDETDFSSDETVVPIRITDTQIIYHMEQERIADPYLIHEITPGTMPTFN